MFWRRGTSGLQHIQSVVQCGCIVVGSVHGSGGDWDISFGGWDAGRTLGSQREEMRQLKKTLRCMNFIKSSCEKFGRTETSDLYDPWQLPYGDCAENNYDNIGRPRTPDTSPMEICREIPPCPPPYGARWQQLLRTSMGDNRYHTLSQQDPRMTSISYFLYSYFLFLSIS